MFFSTLSFASFFGVLFVLYWYIFRKERQRKILLVSASYVFYAFWNWRFCILLFALSIVNYFYGFLLEKEKNYKPRRCIFIIITVLNVLYLCFFKYLYGLLSFFNGFFPDMYNGSAFLTHLRALSILLPIGVSYYTFKCMSYIFDIYLCKMRHVKSLWDLLLYVSFFPQLTSGPIVQAEDFFKELPQTLNCDADKNSRPIELDRAVLLIMSGLYKKTVISNFLTILVTDKIFSNPSFYNTWELLFGMLCYTIIIYADFSGYSDMSIGIALLLGFKTRANFDRPYISKSVSEFWRRWHISFSSWLRDYLYFGLGGSRFGLKRTLFAVFFTMLMAGLWHGGKITFIIWGAAQGLLLVIEKIFYEKQKHKTGQRGKPAYGKMGRAAACKKNTGLVSLIKMLFVFMFVNVSWLIFFSPSLSELQLYLVSLKNITQPFTVITPFILVVFFAGLLLQAPSVNLRKRALEIYKCLPIAVKALFTSAFIVCMYAVSTSGIPSFIYFNF